MSMIHKLNQYLPYASWYPVLNDISRAVQMKRGLAKVPFCVPRCQRLDPLLRADSLPGSHSLGCCSPRSSWHGTWHPFWCIWGFSLTAPSAQKIKKTQWFHKRSYYHRMIETFRFKKSFKIIESKCKPNTWLHMVLKALLRTKKFAMRSWREPRR